MSRLDEKNPSFFSGMIIERTDLRVFFDVGGSRRRRLLSSSSLLCSDVVFSSIFSGLLSVFAVVRVHTFLSMDVSDLSLEVGLFTSGTGCFSGGSWKALSPGSLSLCFVQSRLTTTHNHLCFEDLRQQLLTFQPHLNLTVSASIVRAFSVRGFPPTCRPDPESQGHPTNYDEGSFSMALIFSPFTGSLSSISDNHLRFTTLQIAWLGDDELIISNDWAMPIRSVLKISGGFTGIYNLSFMSYLSFLKNLSVDSPRLVLFPSSFSFEKKILPPFPLSMERDVFSNSFSSVCFSFVIGLLSYGAVSTGPEDTIEITSVILVDEGWTSTSHVTILQLSDFVVKALSTHPSIVLNSLSSSVEDLSYLTYLFVVFSVYGQRGWIIPSIVWKKLEF